MELKVLKNETDRRKALGELERLMNLEPKADSPDSERLKILALLIENYEKEHFAISKPDPVEAIKFRMEQNGLSNRDLVPIIGSPSKVSEVLANKRTLTLSMIRALHDKLGIPADVLVKESTKNFMDIDWSKFPFKEMAKRGWIRTESIQASNSPQEIIRQFLKPLGNLDLLTILCRRTIHERAGRGLDKYSLFAWALRVQIKALALKALPPYSKKIVTEDFLKEIAQFSWSQKGPVIAAEFLLKHGIAFVIEPHLPGTYLDAASLLAKDGRPIIAMTLRHDRLDNFWFCLLHELGHILLHLDENTPVFVDDMDFHNVKDSKEIEADSLASNSFVSRHRWKSSRASQTRSLEDIYELAKELKIHPSIIAGRLRHETRNYHIFKQLVGHGEVRTLFEETPWR